ncbi:MAG: hypothetical protein GX647_10720, partial [Clostridiales bacterium]|nr:hypothetical protein [Clostridiales bacterium]
MKRFARWLSLLLALVIFAAPLAGLAEEPSPQSTEAPASGIEQKGDAPEGNSPTDAPPAEVPQTEHPPTDAPPTDVPPTDAPPTDAPPTDAPPTEVPATETPTGAPPTEIPADGEDPLAGEPMLGMLMMADMPLLMSALEAGEIPRIIYIEFRDGFSGEVLDRMAVIEGGSAAAFPEIPVNGIYTHTGWKLTAYGNAQNFAADAAAASFEDLLPSVPAEEFSTTNSQTECAYVSIQSTYALIDPEHAPFVLEFQEKETEDGGVLTRDADRMLILPDEPDRAHDLPELYLPGSCWTLLDSDYKPVYALASDKLSISYNELTALKQQYGLGFNLVFRTEMNEAYSMTLSFWEKRTDAYWAFDSLGGVKLYEGGPAKTLPLLPEREGYDAFWQGIDIESGEWLGAQFEGTPSLTYAQAVEIVGQQAVAEGYGRDEVSFCAYYVPTLPQGAPYTQLIYLNLMQGGLRVGRVIASPATPDMALPISCFVPSGVRVTGWKLSATMTWPADRTTTYLELRTIAAQRGLVNNTNKDIVMDAEVLIDYDPANPIDIYAIFGDEQNPELYAKRVTPGGSVNFPAGSREDWMVIYTLSDDGTPCLREQRVPASKTSMTYQELLDLVSIAGVRNYYGLPTIQIYFYAPTAEQVPTGYFEEKTIDVVLDGGDWLYFEDGSGNYLGRFHDSVRLAQSDTDARTFWGLEKIGGQLARGGYLFLGWYTASGVKALPANTNAAAYSQMAKYVKFDSNNYARLVLTPKFTFDGVSRGEQNAPIVKKLVFNDDLFAVTGYEKTLTLEYGKTVIAPTPPPLSNTTLKFKYWVLWHEEDMQIIKAGSKITFNTLSPFLSKYGFMYGSVIPLYAWYEGSIYYGEHQIDVIFYGRFNKRLTTRTASSLDSDLIPLPEVTPPEGLVFNGWIVYGENGTVRWYRDRTSFGYSEVKSICADEDGWVEAYALFGAEPVDDPAVPRHPTISIKDGKTAYLGFGETITLVAGPDSLVQQKDSVFWDNRSPSLISVMNNGDGTATVKAGSKAGTAEVIVSYSGFGRSMKLYVSKTPTSVSIPKSLSLLVNGTAKLAATISPKDAKPLDVVWRSSNPEIATVMSNGTVDAMGVGTATITATTLNGKAASCTVTVGRPTSFVKLDPVFTPREYDVGGKVQLSAKAYPLNALQQFDWKSSNTKIATVDANGLVTGVAAGVAKITATAKDGTGMSDSVDLAFVRPVTGISCPPSVHVFVGRTVAVKASALPGAAYLEWAIGHDYYARVSVYGEVTGLNPGETTLRITARNGVTKVIPVSVTVPVSSISVLPDTAEVEIGKTLKLEASVSDAHYPDLRWSSSDTRIAKVDANGLVTGVKAGKAVITATAKDGSGVKDSATVTVYQGVTGIKLSAAQLALTTSQTAALKAALSPSKPKYTGVEWTSSSTGVATVANGVVTAVAPGEAVITAKAHNGLIATCAVRVYPPAQSIAIAGQSEVVPKGKVQLTASALPEGARQDFTWATSNYKVATVSQTGLVTGVKLGSATIKATAKDGSGRFMTFTVAVITGASGVRLSSARLVMKPEEMKTLTAAVSPWNAAHKEVTWTSSNEGVATVANG